MSASGQKQTLRHRLREVRFAPQSGHRELASICPFSANRRHQACLFDHLVGAGEERRWHSNAKRIGGFHIDDQLETSWLLDRQIGGLGAFEDFVDIHGSLVKKVRIPVFSFCLIKRRESGRTGPRRPNFTDVAQLYSITSSARASSIGGTSRPSALAVFRLITNSYCVGCRTGISAGFEPFKICPTYSPAWRYIQLMLGP
jgi:hypothetical protein